ncbi:hypothetical protein Pint_11798 [Pistacia integerrima]|uniref:Uncharacterized protein n=1 Tax=Pistacia integerrima TaxID=434235 RepID=A0ACC0XFM0_9ROSI|nr:hypothetical protein Pint_11798 [Pistacia integerrima]
MWKIKCWPEAGTPRLVEDLGDVAILPTRSSIMFNIKAFRLVSVPNPRNSLVSGSMGFGRILEGCDTPKVLVDLETNECLERNGNCWQDTKANITACKTINISTSDNVPSELYFILKCFSP